MKRIISLILIFACIASLLCACSQKPQGVGETGISAEEFDMLSLGMSVAEVTEIIGGEGELISESKEETNDYYLYIRLYRYEGERSGYAELEFTHKVAKEIVDRIGNHDVSRLSSRTNYSLE